MYGIPYRSQFEPHYELIRDERRARKTWRDIADRLKQEHGLDTTGKVVQAWFKRRQKRQSLPLGFEETTPQTKPGRDGGLKRPDIKRIEKLLKAPAAPSTSSDKWNFGISPTNPTLTKK